MSRSSVFGVGSAMAALMLVGAGCCGPQTCCTGGSGRPGLIECMSGSLRGCSAGCGEIYWNEWFSDPPDPCDPCDWHGNYTGPSCCGNGIVHLPRRLFARGRECLKKLNGSRFVQAEGNWRPEDPNNIHGVGPMLAEEAAPVVLEDRSDSEMHWAAWPTAESR